MQSPGSESTRSWTAPRLRPEPRIYQARDLDEQIRIAAKEIAEEIKLGVPASAYLVLISDGLLVKNVISRLRNYSDGVISITGDDLDPTSVRVCSLDKATGLEAHTVYVLGASDLIDGEGDPTRSEDDRLALRERNGRRLYMTARPGPNGRAVSNRDGSSGTLRWYSPTRLVPPSCLWPSNAGGTFPTGSFRCCARARWVAAPCCRAVCTASGTWRSSTRRRCPCAASSIP